MAHKTLIGGTAYEIDGGKTLVDGTAYNIDKGRTLIGGTGYDISFGPPIPTAMLYSDGSFVFQLGNKADPSHGTLLASYTGFDTDDYFYTGFSPWMIDGNSSNIYSVSFADEISPVSTAYWFAYCDNLTTVDLAKLDTTNTTNMAEMFVECKRLTELDLSSWDTSKVTNMAGMFSLCDRLATIYVSDLWSTSAVKSGYSMFMGSFRLVGGNGTTVATAGVTDYSYAVIDGKNGKPGYLTDIKDKH